jgi:hypothetical protein
MYLQAVFLEHTYLEAFVNHFSTSTPSISNIIVQNQETLGPGNIKLAIVVVPTRKRDVLQLIGAVKRDGMAKMPRNWHQWGSDTEMLGIELGRC